MSKDTNKVFIGFTMDESYARRLYEAADNFRLPVAALIRHVLLSSTDDLTQFGDVPVDYPVGGNARKRFLQTDTQS